MMAGWSMGLEGWLLMAAWAGVMVLVVALLVHEPGRRPADDATAILRARFARGELTEDEYRTATGILQHDAQGTPGAPRRPTHPASDGPEAHHD